MAARRFQPRSFANALTNRWLPAPTPATERDESGQCTGGDRFVQRVSLPGGRGQIQGVLGDSANLLAGQEAPSSVVAPAAGNPRLCHVGNRRPRCIRSSARCGGITRPTRLDLGCRLSSRPLAWVVARETIKTVSQWVPLLDIPGPHAWDEPAWSVSVRDDQAGLVERARQRRRGAWRYNSFMTRPYPRLPTDNDARPMDSRTSSDTKTPPPLRGVGRR